ncbi:solute carrier family 35 member G1-like [Glandiceps talaboti]
MGFFRWLALTLQYYAFKFLPFGDVTAVVRGLTPVLTALAALICLHEPWSCVEIAITLFNIGGVVLVAGPVFIFGEDSIDEDSYIDPDLKQDNMYLLIGFALTVGSGVSFSISYILARSLKDNFSVSCRLVYDSSVGTVLSFTLLYAAARGDPVWSIGSEMAIALAIYAIVENVALYAFYRSFKVEAAATVSMLLNIEVFTTYIYQATVFHLEPEALEITGALIIVFSSAVVFIIKWRRESATKINERETLLEQRQENQNDSRFGSLERSGE